MKTHNFTVLFRPFEERDIDFIFRCKNDAFLNKLTVGNWMPFSYKEAEEWVHNCMKGDRADLKFWAICKNDSLKQIIGWVSLSKIDTINQSVNFHGILIGDPLYRDGIAWIEAYLLIHEYVFEKLGFNRLYGVALEKHKTTQTMRKLMFWTTEGVQRQAVFKNGEYQDISMASLLKDEYFEHKKNGDYELSSIIRHLRILKKSK